MWMCACVSVYVYVPSQTKASQSAPAAPSADTPAPLKASMARLDPVELVRMLDLNIDVAPLQDCSIVPPVSDLFKY